MKNTYAISTSQLIEIKIDRVRLSYNSVKINKNGEFYITVLNANDITKAAPC